MAESLHNHVKLQFFECVSSTMDKAYEMVDALLYEDIGVVIANEQISGRGQHGHSWESGNNGNLYASYVFKVKSIPQNVSGFALVLAVRLAELLENYISSTEIKLKWPNDLLVEDGRKLAGILIELKKNVECNCMMVIGVGVNITSKALNTAACLAEYSVAIESLYAKDFRKNFALELAQVVKSAWTDFICFGFTYFKQDWLMRALYLNQRITVNQLNQQVGIMEGVNDDGALLLKTDKGRKIIYSGEIC